MGMARRQMRRQGMASLAFTAAAVSTARNNRAQRQAAEAATDQMQNQPVQEEVSTTPQSSGVDVEAELEKLKSMLDKGLITQEEYDAKKKELLGL